MNCFEQLIPCIPKNWQHPPNKKGHRLDLMSFHHRFNHPEPKAQITNGPSLGHAVKGKKWRKPWNKKNSNNFHLDPFHAGSLVQKATTTAGFPAVKLDWSSRVNPWEKKSLKVTKVRNKTNMGLGRLFLDFLPGKKSTNTFTTWWVHGDILRYGGEFYRPNVKPPGFNHFGFPASFHLGVLANAPMMLLML